MGAVYFYHLTNSPLEATLPMLLGKAGQAGWRVSVRGSSDARMKWLDEKLWLGAEDGFAPHGLEGGEFDVDQPVLLGTNTAMPNGVQCLMAIDGAEVSADEINAAERTCVLFDGNDPDALTVARGQWKTLTDAGCSAQYWSQDSGSWEKKAESN